MFVEKPTEDGRQRAARLARQNEALDAHIKRIDTENAITMAERVALCQHNNKFLKRPLDYAAIVKYRAERPELFEGLPSDAECQREIRKQAKQAGGSSGE